MIELKYTLKVNPSQIGKAFINAKDFEQILTLEAMVREVENIGHDKWVAQCQRIRDGFIVSGNDEEEVAVVQKTTDYLRHEMISMLEVLQNI